MRLRLPVLESIGMRKECGVQAGLSGDQQCIGAPVVNGVWRHVADPRMAVHGFVPGKERLAVRACVLDATKASREVGSIFHRLELRLRVGVVVRDVRAAVALGDVQIHQQRGHRLGAHAGTAIGVQRQRARQHIVTCHGLGNELLGQLGALAQGEQPAHHAAAEDVQDHVQVKARPLGRPFQLGCCPMTTPGWTRWPAARAWRTPGA